MTGTGGEAVVEDRVATGYDVVVAGLSLGGVLGVGPRPHAGVADAPADAPVQAVGPPGAAQAAEGLQGDA